MIRVTFEIPDRDRAKNPEDVFDRDGNHTRVLNYVRESYLREISTTWVIEYTED